MTDRKKWWHLGRRGRGSVTAAFSMVEELFRPMAAESRQVMEEQKRQALEISGNADGPKKMTIKMSKPPSD
ncbi:MAG TPA: hypothetical protein VMV52_06995 [Candidatus Nanopelagicaceae bacterium]|nr:hypothetical protein [Candidatus Nanopelagicaceae bacterium]